jgi:hypothetical protein
VLIVSHLCHPLPSANDNGSGVAANLETARTLAALERAGHWRPSARAVRFLWMPELTGTPAWLGRDAARADRTHAALNLDMVGEDQERCGSTSLIEHPPAFLASFAEELLVRIRAEALDWVTSYAGPGHYSMMRLAEVPFSGGSDHVPLLDPGFGVPCPMLIQWPDRFYHSSHDTVEMTDPRSLELAVRCAATYAGFLAAAGEPEQEWLAALVERGARRRLLEAADAEHSRRLVERERMRGDAAIASLGRLGVAPERLRAARVRWREFADLHAPVSATPPRAAAGGPVPHRVLAAPLDFQPHLWPQYSHLAAEEREELRRLLDVAPGGRTSFDLAWWAADGRRGLAEVAELVHLETGVAPEARGAEPGSLSLERFFTLSERLGLSRWTEDR